jgi:putative phosphoesterase
MALVAVIADTHLPRGSRRLPDACVARLAAADAILHAGDVMTTAVLDELRALGPPVHAVCGNADEAALKESLPRTAIVEIGGARIGMTHVPGPAAGRDGRLLARFPGCDAVVYGHTHLPRAEVVDGVWLLNPGSPTERRRAPTHTMIELTVGADGLDARLIELT